MCSCAIVAASSSRQAAREEIDRLTITDRARGAGILRQPFASSARTSSTSPPAASPPRAGRSAPPDPAARAPARTASPHNRQTAPAARRIPPATPRGSGPRPAAFQRPAHAPGFAHPAPQASRVQLPQLGHEGRRGPAFQPRAHFRPISAGTATFVRHRGEKRLEIKSAAAGHQHRPPARWMSSTAARALVT